MKIQNAPWAALLAVLMVGYVDRELLSDRERWVELRDALEELPEPVVRVELGKAKDVLQLSGLAEAPPNQRRLVVLGNRRAKVGLLFRLQATDRIQLAKLAHAAVSPFVMRTMARDVAASKPDLCVLMLSELDTHRPVDLVPSACFRSPEALLQLLLLEPSIAVHQRREVEQLVAGNLFDSYLQGDLLDRAYLNELREIHTQADGDQRKGKERRRRGGKRNRPVPRKRLEVEAGKSRYPVKRVEEPDIAPPPIENLDEIRDEIMKFFKRKKLRNSTLNIGYAIQKGPHAETQKALIDETIAILRAAGSDVLILEGPLNPLTHLLYDKEGTREEFLAFVEEMKRKHGVHFQSLDETGPFPDDDFTDLLHLRGPAARRLSEDVLDRVRGILDDRAASSPGATKRPAQGADR